MAKSPLTGLLGSKNRKAIVCCGTTDNKHYNQCEYADDKPEAIDLYHLSEEALQKIYGNPAPYNGKPGSEHTESMGMPCHVSGLFEF